MTATGFVQSNALVNVDTASEWISCEFGLATADKTADRVCAYGIWSAGFVLTLVDI